MEIVAASRIEQTIVLQLPLPESGVIGVTDTSCKQQRQGALLIFPAMRL